VVSTEESLVPALEADQRRSSLAPTRLGSRQTQGLIDIAWRGSNKHWQKLLLEVIGCWSGVWR
jgi:hypothetical protein